MRVAVIPARGGSKRIPRKNVREFCGRPMIAWPVAAALESGLFDRIVVSTDDEEIAAVARACGAEVPFLRPPELSGDHVGTMPVIRHAIDWLGSHGAAPTEVCCLYATAPFVRGDDLRRALELLAGTGCDFTFPVTSYPFPIQRAVRINGRGRVEMFSPDEFHSRSQDLEEAYHDAGQFYWGSARAWQDNDTIFCADSAPLVLPRHRVQDIDTPEDWQRAELLFRIGRELP